MKPKAEYAVRIENVNKYFTDKQQKKLREMFKKNSRKKKFHSVKDISITVEQGSVYGILGPNGCGKSTLIRMITTLLIPDTGSIELFGIDVESRPWLVKDFIGRVSVDASLFPKLTALENLDYTAGIYGLERKKARQDAIDILTGLGFPQDKMKLSVEDLSRGQQQKISIARGFLAKPKLLLLDEPTTGLDPVSKIDVQRFITKVRREQEMTIIITSHDMSEIEKLCDKLVIMDKGAIIARGSPDELKSSYCDTKLFEIMTTDLSRTKELLELMEGVNDVKLATDEKGKSQLTARIDDIDYSASDIINSVKKHGITFVGLQQVLPTLEEVFVELTGKRLKDEGEKDD